MFQKGTHCRFSSDRRRRVLRASGRNITFTEQGCARQDSQEHRSKKRTGWQKLVREPSGAPQRARL